ncbi:MAG: group II intron maturase-specific domain-containing protein [Nitrosospira sp.]
MVYRKDALRQTLSGNAFRLSGVSIPAPVRAAPWGRIIPQLSPRSQCESRKGKSIRQTIRSWKTHRWIQLTIEELAASFNPVLRG